MICAHPLAWERLVAYWAGDLPQAELDTIDEHLMGCAACSAEAERVAALVAALHAFIPAVVSRAELESLRARGLRIEENTFLPGQRTIAHFRPGLDVLVHRLSGLELSRAERVALTVRVESTGQVFLSEPDVPFEPREGVLIACQRHFEHAPPDVQFEVTVSSGGVDVSTVYPIPHVFEPAPGVSSFT